MDEILYLIAVIFLGGLVNSTFGFGFALTTMPLLSLRFGLNLLGPLIPLLFITAGSVIVFRSRKNIQFKSILPLILTATLMVPLGVYLGKYGHEALIKIILGILIIFFSIYNLSNTQLPSLKNDKWAPLFGGISGLFAGAYNIAGPPAAIYGTLRQWSPQIFRASLQSYLLYVNLFVVSNHIYMGSYQQIDILPYYLYSCPTMLLAVPIGKKINSKISNPKAFNKYVYILMACSGLMLIFKAFQIA